MQRFVLFWRFGGSDHRAARAASDPPGHSFPNAYFSLINHLESTRDTQETTWEKSGDMENVWSEKEMMKKNIIQSQI